MRDRSTDRNYEDLANAIVIQAVKDYRDDRKRLKKDLSNEKAIPEMISILRFLRSSWYKQLTDLDGELIIKQIQEEKI